MSFAFPSLRARRAAPSVAPEFFARMLRRALIALGVLITALGVLISPLPGPGGLPVTALGLIVLLRNSPKAKRMFIRAERRWPNVIHPLRRLIRKEPEIAPVFWQQYLRIERIAVPKRYKRYRPGVRGRHMLKRRFSGEA